MEQSFVMSFDNLDEHSSVRSHCWSEVTKMPDEHLRFRLLSDEGLEHPSVVDRG
jgi:hypothetical protein